jgi:3-dehydroquinate synthase
MEEIFTTCLSTGTTAVVECDDLLRHEAPAAAYVADGNTRSLVDGSDVPWVVLAPGERQKRWDGVAEIIDLCLEIGLARDGVLFGVGGGVICDTAAFAASIYQRGVEVILVPTTLLAMVDAALGGKTGINYGGYKNMVGTFHPAREVRVHIPFLATLPEREFRSGLAEVIKSAMLWDAELLQTLEERRAAILSRDEAVLRRLVLRSLAVKKHFVEEDATEQGVRAHLNLGHTFGHGLEAGAGLGEWTHGEAVVWGMARALDAGLELGYTDPAYRKRCMDLFDAYGYRVRASGVDLDRLLKAMSRDKKKKSGSVRFILQKNVGETFVTPIDADVLRNVVANGITADGISKEETS